MKPFSIRRNNKNNLVIFSIILRSINLRGLLKIHIKGVENGTNRFKEKLGRGWSD